MMEDTKIRISVRFLYDNNNHGSCIAELSICLPADESGGFLPKYLQSTRQYLAGQKLGCAWGDYKRSADGTIWRVRTVSIDARSWDELRELVGVYEDDVYRIVNRVYWESKHGSPPENYTVERLLGTEGGDSDWYTPCE